ncbi:MAG: hypothetical protein IJQ85_08410 [Selenomonadaceae bacterium]|nr:hypothetical protein [Selenomonadaceae bacterium]
MNFKKKLLVGLLGGALILTGGSVSAAPEIPEFDEAWQEESATPVGGWTKYFSEKYGVDSAQLEKAFKDGFPMPDIRHAAVLSKLSGKSFSDVLAMKIDWPQVAEKLGVTDKQVKEYFKQEREEFFAKYAEIDVKTLKALLKDGYHPHDIAIAGRIAKASGKDVKSVLGKRKINNTWDDVAKSYGVDMKKIMPPGHAPGNPPGNFHGRHHRK